MSMRFLLIPILLISNLAFSAPKPSQSNPIYEIEILVFKSMREDLAGDEVWVQQDAPVDTTALDNALIIGGAPPRKSSLSLAAEKMASGNSYRVLSHKRWIQSAEPKLDAQPVRIQAAEGASTQLDGTIKFYMSRFLHLDVNLSMQDLESSDNDSDNPADANTYSIKEHRRIKSVDIHYFDHPKFGVLIQVQPVEINRQ